MGMNINMIGDINYNGVWQDLGVLSSNATYAWSCEKGNENQNPTEDSSLNTILLFNQSHLTLFQNVLLSD